MQYDMNGDPGPANYSYPEEGGSMLVITCETKSCHKPEDSDLNFQGTKSLNIITILIHRCFMKV
jgi:hypothetical protein